MRFLADGPLIPDELLIARDEGRVVFFCGAGVSQECAGLPDFFELANMVIQDLGVSADDPAMKIFERVQKDHFQHELRGLVSADRIFAFLERSFDVQDIEAAVAKALKPKSSTDLSAHKIMIDLARTPDGNTRIVTTNFDLLFEECDPSLPHSRYLRLPDPQRNEEFKGVIHLHGHVDQDYLKAAGDGFILSSRGFGRAYLAEGWATSFIKSVLDKYIVVFIGYTADDPPVQYLLEALSSISKSPDKIFAFQDGPADEAEAKWGHKGVQAIAYYASGGHKTLWETLKAWAERAKDPDAWYDKIIAMARKGPESLIPHERGQVAHLVSFLKGVRRFSDSADPPPAEWLCVFDPSRRYGNPGHLGSLYEQGPYFDPFDAYGIDTDPLPPKIGPSDFHTRREIPEGLLDIFSATRRDTHNLKEDSFSTLKGASSVGAPGLPNRLWFLGLWISKVSDQPAAAWWASHQVGIHTSIRRQIRYYLERKKQDCSKEVRQAWQYVFKAWAEGKNDFHESWYKLKAFIDIDGWSDEAIKEFARICRPFLKVDKPMYQGSKPPENKEGIRIEELVHLDVEYPWEGIDIQIPDEFLLLAIREFRKNMEDAVYLENEIGGFGLHQICPIELDPDIKGHFSDRAYGISRLFLFFVNLMRKLVIKNPVSARQEFLAWWTEEETAFARLRIWMAGHKSIFSGDEAGRIFCNLTNPVFWNGRHRRDLLLVIKKRWDDFPVSMQKRLEKRILKGRSCWCGEKRSEFIESRSWETLNRIHWLKNQGCRFTFDIDEQTEKIQKLAPKWQLEYAEKAAASLEGRSGRMKTETEYSVLLDEPIETLLEKIEELTKTSHGGFATRDPFTGLSTEQPAIAIAALAYEAKLNKYRGWAWRKFLTLEARKKDAPGTVIAIIELILNMPPSALSELMYPISEWIFNLSVLLFNDYSEQFDQIWEKLINALKIDSSIGKSSMIRGGKEPDWATEALNAPVGNLLKALMNDPAIAKLNLGGGLPSPSVDRIGDLLALEGDLRRYALVMSAFHLNLFYAIAPDWTENYLISVLDQNGDDNNAFWDGFFWRAMTPDKLLYMRLKPFLLRLACFQSGDLRSEINTQVLSGILLAGWETIEQKTGNRLVTNDEMRKALLDSDEAFRLNTLWHLETRIANEKKRRGKRSHDESFLIFLAKVWPRQMKVKSQKISETLLDIAFSSSVNFSKLTDLILPFLTATGQYFHGFYMLGKEKSVFVERFPKKTLKLICAILPENVSEWPFGIKDILDRIGIADPSLLKDSRLVELNRRWDAGY